MLAYRYGCGSSVGSTEGFKVRDFLDGPYIQRGRVQNLNENGVDLLKSGCEDLECVSAFVRAIAYTTSPSKKPTTFSIVGNSDEPELAHPSRPERLLLIKLVMSTRWWWW